ARLVVDDALGMDDCALACALVDDLDHARAAMHCTARRQRPVQFKAVLARHGLDPVDAAVELFRPEAGIAEHHRHGGQHLEVLLVDEGKLVRVGRIVPKPDAERIEHAVLRAVGVLDLGNLQRQEFFVDDGHRTLSSREACYFPPPCAEGLGVGVARCGTMAPHRTTPRPSPTRGEGEDYTGSQENTSLERSSGVNEGASAALRWASSFSGVQPPERWIVRIGRGWLNRKTSLLRTPKICPVMPSARSEAR